MLQLVGSWRIRPAVQITSTGWKPVPLSDAKNLRGTGFQPVSMTAPLPYFVVSSKFFSVLPEVTLIERPDFSMSL